ncbi:hypothetical protein DAEQUDRAFT_713635 [Daedalea quercina L-15889]|uniref:ZW10 C-terminal helical domain-containing protein n=1 Tax=Daedalea quercina L-15889 TaxID=1314783 RepID=A0A165NU28_9APHY|nr:hypothetical protein DAEQUDRAFT_713635 [Daedalea quercina L-15889]
MAFPVPAHLPRGKDPQDISTKILTKVSETDTKSLNAAMVSSWIAELDETIAETKTKIHERIASDLPFFNEQLSGAKSIQERLRMLTDNVDKLDGRLSDSESGLVPTLLATLTRHAQLAQETLDASVKRQNLIHLAGLKRRYDELTALVGEGKLPEAVETSSTLETELQASPEPLTRSSVMGELRRSFTATKARVEEQLNDAYMRSVVASSLELIVRPSVQVRQSETTLSLKSVLASLSSASLTEHLNHLRRELTQLYVEYIAKQPVSVDVFSAGTIAGAAEHKLTLFPSPPDSQDLGVRLDGLSNTLTFLNEHLFPHFPPAERKSFSLSLCRPIRAAVLNHVLIPALPSSPDGLPRFLDLLDRAQKFELDYLDSMLGDDGGEQEIKGWASGVGMHYERKRRMQLLEAIRVVIMTPEDKQKMITVDIEIRPEFEEGGHASFAAEPHSEAVESDIDVAWDFDGEQHAEGQENDTVADEDGWGFGDEEVEPQPVDKSSAPLPPPPLPAEEDPDDAWGLNDDDALDTPSGEEEDPWNDGWGDGDEEPKQTTQAPKPAKGLAKLTSKGKNGIHKADEPPIRSPVPVAPPPPTPLVPALPKPAPVPPPVLKETYMVSGRTKELVRHVESILEEGEELVASGLLASHQSPTSPTGSVILQAAPLTLDVFRAVYPVTFSAILQQSPKQAMRFSNDCLYLSIEVWHIRQALEGSAATVSKKLQECGERLKLLGESWYSDVIDQQCQFINELLDKAAGFVETTDQDRFDDCENAVNQVLRRIRRVSQEWKPILNKSKYYEALGFVVDAALSRMLADVLALPDITADESNRLSELCRIFNALEGLFVEDLSQPSFVVSYVSSWLKFSYLSELLEASMADITYLFEEGALVDFEIDELVRLVRALFADTPLRANAINKFLGGHPLPS